MIFEHLSLATSYHWKFFRKQNTTSFKFKVPGFAGFDLFPIYVVAWISPAYKYHNSNEEFK